MSFKNFMATVRYWDTLTAKWLMRHFYFTFFQVVLLVIFFLWFANIFNMIDASLQVTRESAATERILASQSMNMTIIVLLMILNSFWLLFVFNSIQRLQTLLKDIAYHLSRLRIQNK